MVPWCHRLKTHISLRRSVNSAFCILHFAFCTAYSFAKNGQFVNCPYNEDGCLTVGLIHESTAFASPSGRGVAPCVTERGSHSATLYPFAEFYPTRIVKCKPVGVDLLDDPSFHRINLCGKQMCNARPYGVHTFHFAFCILHFAFISPFPLTVHPLFCYTSNII